MVGARDDGAHAVEGAVVVGMEKLLLLWIAAAVDAEVLSALHPPRAIPKFACQP